MENNEMTVKDYKELFEKVVSMSIDIEGKQLEIAEEDFQKILMYIKGMIECLDDVPKRYFDYYFKGTEKDIEEFLYN